MSIKLYRPDEWVPVYINGERRMAQPAGLRATAKAQINIKVRCENGDFIRTGFNGTIEDARAYYIGREFVTHEDEETGREEKTRFVSVELLKS